MDDIVTTELYIIQRAYLRYIGHVNALVITLECRGNHVGCDVSISESALKQLIETLHIQDITRGDIEDIDITEHLDHVPIILGFNNHGIAVTIASPLDPNNPIKLQSREEETNEHSHEQYL